MSNTKFVIMLKHLLLAFFPKTIQEIKDEAITHHELMLSIEADELFATITDDENSETEQVQFGEETGVVIEFAQNENLMFEKLLFALIDHMGLDFLNILRDKYGFMPHSDIYIKLRNELLARESK